MSVTLSEVKRAARAHRAPLAGESAGYLVLAIADQVLSAPRLVQAADIQLTEDGALRVLSGQASSDADAELSLRRALDQLLLVASSGSAALSRASRRTAPLGLSSLVRELEAALIPVNRAAARRALARVHRETVRALANGVLPEEEPELAPLAEPVVAAPAVAAPVVAAPVVAAPVVAAPVVAAPVVAAPVVAAPAALLSDPAGAALTRVVPAVSAPVPAPITEAEQLQHLDGVLSALCEELPAPPQLEESDALTIALDVRELKVAAAPLDFEVHFEPEAVDSGAAPTVMLALDVEPVPELDVAAAEQPLLDPPLEACTRPEPVVLRKSMRPLQPLPPPESEALPRTPTLGSWAAQLPILGPEQLAQLNAAQAELIDESELVDDLSAPAPEATELELGSAPSEDPTELMPEVQPLSPGVAMVPSRKSDVSELLSSFQIGPDDSNQGLCRAIKEMADLDLTPAPFAALIR